jgi:sucrose-6-phosphate hydrolase SacC (GH32 family)
MVWECPDLVYLESEENPEVKKWLLVVNVNPGGFQLTSGVLYYIGEFDGRTFTADDPSRTDDYLDYGSDFYAVTSFFKLGGVDQVGITKAESIAWMSNWAYT